MRWLRASTRASSCRYPTSSRRLNWNITSWLISLPLRPRRAGTCSNNLTSLVRGWLLRKTRIGSWRFSWRKINRRQDFYKSIRSICKAYAISTKIMQKNFWVKIRYTRVKKRGVWLITRDKFSIIRRKRRL